MLRPLVDARATIVVMSTKAISRELCKAMGGQLRCTSLVGQGSVFTCELPLPGADAPHEAPLISATPSRADTGIQRASSEPSGHAQAARSAPGKRSDAGHAPPHVLLVDDNPVNTIVAEAELHLLGLRVSTFESAQAALDWLTCETPDLILMDCEMPVLDGVSATRQIRAREKAAGQPPVPIIALTANGRDTYEQRCRPAGMNDYLSKPFERADLHAVVTRQLARASNAQARAPQPA